MKRRLFILILAMYAFVLPFVLQSNTVYAATKSITMTEGESQVITIPKKGKYLYSSESNEFITSKANYKSKKVTITAITPGTSKLTIKTTKNKTYKYSITVLAKQATDNTPTEVGEECPFCKHRGYLKENFTTYTRNAIKTGYLKEPLISKRENYEMHFSKELTEEEIQNLVKSWHGIILSKYNDLSYTAAWKLNKYSTFAYNILVPAEYSYGNKASDYQKQLATNKHLETAFDVCDWSSIINSHGAECQNFYLSEWTLEEITEKGPESKTISSGVIECGFCGYKYAK